MKKLIVIFFSAALGISFLFIGFGSYFSEGHAIKIGNIKITISEFSREFENYKSENQLNNLTEEEELYSKITFVNQYVNQLVFEDYLNQKISISDKSKKTILKKSLNNDEMFNNLDSTRLQNYLKEISSGINKDIFNNALNAQELISIDINEALLIEKNLNIFEIKENLDDDQFDIDQSYFDEFNFYKVFIKKYDIYNYLNDQVITSNIIESYYNENLAEFESNDEYSYEQIILDEKKLINFEEYKNKEDISFNFFENVNENLILPQVKKELLDLEIGEISEAITIGNNFFYIKKLNFNEAYVKKFQDVKDSIRDNLIQLEIDQFELTSENEESLTQYLNEDEIITNSFDFYRNIPLEFNFISFINFEGEEYKDNNLYKYTVVEISSDELTSKDKNNFNSNYSLYKKNIEVNHNKEDLTQNESIKVNYFMNSLKIKNFNISNEDLERIIIIKPDELLKLVLPNEVIYLSINSTSTIDPLNIKQNIINQIYSNIINQIKENLEIEVDNQQLLKL